MCHSFGFLSSLNPAINLVVIHSPSTWDHQILLSILLYGAKHYVSSQITLSFGRCAIGDTQSTVIPINSNAKRALWTCHCVTQLGAQHATICICVENETFYFVLSSVKILIAAIKFSAEPVSIQLIPI